MKAARGKQHITYSGTTIQMTVDFLSEIIKARRTDHTFKVLKERNCQHRILYLSKNSLGMRMKWNLSQKNENLENSLPADLLQKNC